MFLNQNALLLAGLKNKGKWATFDITSSICKKVGSMINLTQLLLLVKHGNFAYAFGGIGENVVIDRLNRDIYWIWTD